MTEKTSSLTCTFHPKRETRLRCNRCNRPICIKCAKHTPTGYRCPECIKTQQKAFITAQWQDYFIAVFVGGLFSFLGSLLAVPLGFFTLFVAPVVGTITVTVIRKLISNRRSPTLTKVVTGTALLGSSPVVLIQVIRAVPLISAYGLQAAGSLYSLVWVVVYAGILTSTVYYRLS